MTRSVQDNSAAFSARELVRLFLITATNRELSGSDFSPPLRGGVAARSIRCRAASSARADGVVIIHSKIPLELNHHPVRSIEEASRYFTGVAATPPRRGKTVPIRYRSKTRAVTNVAAKAASLLSRSAATDLSHGRQAVVGCRLEPSPVGAKDSQEIFRPYGAHRHIGLTVHGLAPVAKICRRAAALIGCASRDILEAEPRRGGEKRSSSAVVKSGFEVATSVQPLTGGSSEAYASICLRHVWSMTARISLISGKARGHRPRLQRQP
jgi:hypothetical protein